MDILIKNINKPKNCILEEHLSDGTVVKHEVVELPPHGRLKDESVIMDKIQALLKERSWMYASHAQEIIDIITDAPIVIEETK